MSSPDWSVAPTIVLAFSGPGRTCVGVGEASDGTFTITLQAIGGSPDFAAAVQGGGSISTGSPSSGVPFAYTPPGPRDYAGSPVVTIRG